MMVFNKVILILQKIYIKRGNYERFLFGRTSDL